MKAHHESGHEQGSGRSDGSGPVASTPAERDTWWIRHPDRLERELRELSEVGIRYERDAKTEELGLMRLSVFPHVPSAEGGSTELPLIATYPDHYPYFQVIVEAHTLDLQHHQHPFAKTLCLLPRSTSYWNPGSDSLAKLLTERLQLVMDVGSTSEVDSVAALEEHVPEPFGDYYECERDSLVLLAFDDVAGARIPDSVVRGSLLLSIEGVADGAPIPRLLRGAVLEVRDDNGATLRRAGGAIAARYARRIEGRWGRVPAPVRPPSATEVARIVYETGVEIDGGRDAAHKHATTVGGQLQVRAILFPEERHWRGDANAVGDGWAIAVRHKHASPPSPQGAGARGRVNAAQFKRSAPARVDAGYYLALPARYALRDLAVRAPELSALRAHTVAVFGLGCLGAPSALEFARASVQGLRLLDHDIVSAGTTVRWPFGIGMAGGLKAQLLTDLVRGHYPYVAVHAEIFRIGGIRGLAASGQLTADSEEDVMQRMLDGATLVYDATAETGIQYFLSKLARERGLPYIGVQATAGGWGGVVTRITPETAGCWVCLQHWKCEVVEEGGIPAPPHDVVGGDVVVEGCSDPTYTGANFDLAVVSAMGVRTAISTLVGSGAGNYPPTNWDVAVLSLRSPSGELVVPQWSTYSLHRHPDCAACNGREARATDVDPY